MSLSTSARLNLGTAMLYFNSKNSDHLFVLLQAGKLDAAASACERVLHDRPDDPAVLHIFGLVEVKRGHYGEAATLLDRAVAVQGDDAALHNNCGEAHRLRGNLDVAFGHFKRSIEIDWGISAAHINLGLVMRAQGKVREAEHFFKNAVLLRPDMPKPYLELAELYREDGDTFKATQCYRQALSLEREPAAWQQWAGAALAELGDLRSALKVLKRSTESGSGDARTWVQLARAQFELCREPEAVSSYRRALEIDPAIARHASPRVVVARRERPQSYCERESAEYRRLAKAQWLRLPPPRAFPSGAADKWIPADMNEPSSPEIFLLGLENAEVLPDDFSVLAQGSMLVDGLVNLAQFYGFNGRFVVHEADDHRVLLDMPDITQPLDEPCAVMGGGGDHFAFLLEGLARLWALEQQPQIAALPLIVPQSLGEDQHALLERLGIGTTRLRPLAADRTYRCKKLYVPSLPLVGDWIAPTAIQFLRRKLTTALGDAPRTKRRIYFSRAGCSTRRVQNEQELLPHLDRHGFEIIPQLGLGIGAQLGLFREAEAIVAMDDEILANLVIAPLGARIGAITTRGIYRPRAYFIAAQLGLDFTYFQAGADFESHPSHTECDVILPAEALQEYLSRL